MPHVISPLILAQKFANKKQLTFDLSQVNDTYTTRKQNLMIGRNKDSKYV